MSQKNNKEKTYHKWLKRFDKKVWSRLSETSKQRLCQRFEIEYSTTIQINDIVKQINLPVPPRSFTIAAVNETRTPTRNKDLIIQNPYTNLWMSKIYYDIDKWGIIRNNRPYYELLKNTSINDEQKKLFERLLVSSTSLNKDEKIKVLTAIPKLSTFQITALIQVWEEETLKFSELFTENRDDVEKLINKAEQEWNEIEPNLTYYIGSNENEKIILDKYNHLIPESIMHVMSESVKGQKDATETIATKLYYQHKVKFFYDEKSFPSLNPILISGATGSGKSFLIQTGCDIIGLPHIHVDCSNMVSAGIKGVSSSDIIKNLLRKTNYNIKDAETAIIILDEVDKLLDHHDGQSILFQLLRLIEGSNIPIDKSSQSEEREFANIKSISTDKMLFILAGSFQRLIDDKRLQSGFIKEENITNKPITIDDIKKTKLPKELLGRISDIVVLNKLQSDDYRSILLDSKHSPIKKYQKMLKINDTEYHLNDDQIEKIIEYAKNSSYGARSLEHIVNKYFYQILFNAPNNVKKKTNKELLWKY